jgi:hypothetical protein
VESEKEILNVRNQKLEKKNLRAILFFYWKNKKNYKTSPIKEFLSIDKVEKKMEKVNHSYNSIMDIHKILVDVYKKFVKRISPK